MAFSIREAVSAIFNGAPTPEAAAKYTAQLTALILIYFSFVAIFLMGVYVRAVERKPAVRAESRLFKIWIAYALICSILMIVAYLIYFLVTRD
jgi:hypothetical protein